MIVGPYSLIAGFRCPACRQKQPLRALDRTNPTRGLWAAVPEHHACARCATRLRLSGAHKWKVAILQIAVFLFAAVLGAMLLSNISFLVRPENTRGGPNFLGFLIIIFLIVLPAVTFCYRLRRVEVVE